MSPSVPDNIGRYRIRGELGRGSMGVVYEAHDPTLDRTVALKAVQLHDSVDPSEYQAFEERFLAEARAAARLSHPGIVVVHDVGRDERSGALFMALEYLRGRTLAEISAAQGALGWQEALDLAGRVAAALHHAHGNGIVHRDVKPANVMLLASGEVKVLDFGIAKLQSSHAQLTSTGQYLGTPVYMSPEQALGKPVDARSDVFSLGLLLYQLLTGKRLFEADSIPRILTKIAYEPARPPSEASPGILSEVDAIVLHALAKPPAERYADAKSLGQDIAEVLAGRPPRHAPAAVGGGTLVSTARPREGPPQPVRHATAPTLPPPPSPVPVAPPGVRQGRQRHRPSILAGLAATALFAAGLLTALLIVGKSPGPNAGATSPDAGVADSSSARSTSWPGTRLAAEEPTLLAIDFEHHYKQGTLHVWVDKQLVLERSLGGRVKADLGGIKFREGSVDAAIGLKPGIHHVWVEVNWDDNRRAEGLSGDFQAGRTRRLRIRIDRFLKKMSLKWQ